MKFLQRKLLAQLETLRDEIVHIDEPSSRKEKLLAAFATVESGFDGGIATNFREHVDQILAAAGYDIDNLISFLQRSIDLPFDLATLEDKNAAVFDTQYGTETNLIFEQLELPEEVSLERMKYSSRFHPTPVKVFRRALNILQAHIPCFDQWILIDIGSGLGRNLLLANEYPFKRIIGIEISAFLCGKAIENIERYNQRTTHPCLAEVVCRNVLEYDFPENDTILYFWEPFKENIIMEQLLQVLDQKAKEHKTRFILVFMGNCYVEAIASSSFLPIEITFEPEITETGKLVRLTFFANFS